MSVWRLVAAGAVLSASVRFMPQVREESGEDNCLLSGYAPSDDSGGGLAHRIMIRWGPSNLLFAMGIAVFPILADAVDVKRGDQLCETVSQPSIQPDKVVRPMGS